MDSILLRFLVISYDVLFLVHIVARLDELQRWLDSVLSLLHPLFLHSALDQLLLAEPLPFEWRIFFIVVVSGGTDADSAATRQLMRNGFLLLILVSLAIGRVDRDGLRVSRFTVLVLEAGFLEGDVLAALPRLHMLL